MMTSSSAASDNKVATMTTLPAIFQFSPQTYWIGKKTCKMSLTEQEITFIFRKKYLIS